MRMIMRSATCGATSAYCGGVSSSYSNFVFSAWKIYSGKKYLIWSVTRTKRKYRATSVMLTFASSCHGGSRLAASLWMF